MTLDKCRDCDLVINRKGEQRPAIRCKDCKHHVCFQCAKLEASLCEMMRLAGKAFWICDSCEAKSTDLKSVLDSIQNMHSEMIDIKKNQDGQKVEQERMLEGTKVVETVVKRMEDIERTQLDHGERLLEQEASTKKTKERIDETRQERRKLSSASREWTRMRLASNRPTRSFGSFKHRKGRKKLCHSESTGIL